MKQTGLHRFRVGLALTALALVVVSCVSPSSVTEPATGGLRLATFRCDITPPLGEPMIWDVPLAKVETPLLAKGVVLEDDGRRYVLVAFDWCLIGNESTWLFREQIAQAAGTVASCVSLHTVHQHDAPYADAGAHRLLEAVPQPPPHLSTKFLDDLQARLTRAVRKAVKNLEPFDHVGYGAAKVERVASERRLEGPDGKPIMRMSTGGKNPQLAALPEGDIDPFLKTITFARGTKPLVRLHYYATHPQTVSCDGRATADFVGSAREALERSERVFEIYFTGCAGDVTVGKYNDGTAGACAALAQRLRTGMEAAIAASQFGPATQLLWRTESVTLPIRTDPQFVNQSSAWLANPKVAAGHRIYRGAMRLASIARAARPFELNTLQCGPVHLVNLPGEPMLEFQKFTQHCRQNDFVAVAGYADAGSAYICTDQAFREGGYEPEATNLAPGGEQVLKAAIRRLLMNPQPKEP